MDDRYAAADACLEQVAHIVFGRGAEQLRTEIRDHLFVRRDDALARPERPLGELERRMRAAHKLGADLHVGVGENHVDVVNDPVGERISREITQVEDIFYIYRIADPLGDEPRVLCQHLGGAAADDAKAEYGYVYHDCQAFRKISVEGK